MADGFLSPEGEFFEKTETYHAETARRILGGDQENSEPVSELIRRGYLAMIEFRAPDSRVSLQPDLDYVLGKRDGVLTEIQIAWLKEHLEKLSRHQQYTVNMDTTGIFKDLQLGRVKIYPACKECEELAARMAWCEGRREEEPKPCMRCENGEGRREGRKSGRSEG